MDRIDGTPAALAPSMRNERLSWFASVLPLALLAACNTITTGDNGVLTFTPDDCGKSSCSLDEELVIGGSTVVTLDDAGEGDVDDLTLISSDPYVLRVELVERGAFDSEWRVTGTGAGSAEIIAIDAYGYEIDYTEVEVRRADKLALDREGGNAVGPSVRVNFDEVWTVNAGEDVSLHASPYRNGWKLMGRVSYDVSIDEILFDGLSPGARVELGELRFNVPYGEYPVTFRAPDGTAVDVLIVAQ